MTIVTKKEKNPFIPLIISGLGVLLIVAAIGGVFFYNEVVNLRHEIEVSKEEVRSAEVRNAELKNDLYAVTARVESSAFLESRGYILDNNPEYVKTQQLVRN